MTVTDGHSVPLTLRPERPRETLTCVITFGDPVRMGTPVTTFPVKWEPHRENEDPKRARTYAVLA